MYSSLLFRTRRAALCRDVLCATRRRDAKSTRREYDTSNSTLFSVDLLTAAHLRSPLLAPFGFALAVISCFFLPCGLPPLAKIRLEGV